MRSFWSELRLGLRLVLKSPTASLVAIVALGLGIGANTAIFSVADGIVLHPLPYANADRLVSIAQVRPQTAPNAPFAVSYADYGDWLRQARSFQALTAYQYRRVNLSGAGTPYMALGALVSTNFFDVLPSSPILGRAFLPEESQPGRDREVILGQALWKHQFGANPAIIGQTVEVDQLAYTVVGVMDQQATMPTAVELWLPLALTPQQLASRQDHLLFVIGELRSGVGLPAGAAEMRGLVARTDATYPTTDRGWGVYVQPLTQFVTGKITVNYTWLLMGAVGFLLLLACAQVANLQFARALGRNREWAIRAALGADRARLLRQMLTESIVLGLGGTLVGFAFAAVAIRLILAAMPADVAVYVGGWNRIGLNHVALLFTLLIGLGAGILAGLPPAWHASRPDLNSTLKEGGGGAIGRARGRLRHPGVGAGGAGASPVGGRGADGAKLQRRDGRQ